MTVLQKSNNFVLKYLICQQNIFGSCKQGLISYFKLFYCKDLVSLIAFTYYLVIKCTEQYNKLFELMEFTHINKCQTSLSKQRRPTHDSKTPFKYDTSSTQRSNLQEILTNIDQITMTRSFHLNKMNQQDNTMASSKTIFHNYPKEQHDQARLVQFQQGNRPLLQRKSLIYSEHNTNKSSVHQSLMGLQIKIFYFNLPTYKLFNYDQNTTISDLIVEAVDAYIADRQLDSNKIQDRYYKNYQMRLLFNENKHQADMNVPPLSYDRLLIDNLIDALVLLQTQKFQQIKHKMGSKQRVKTPIKLPLHKQQHLNIFLFNQSGEQLASIKMKRQDSIEDVYRFVRENDLHQMKTFYLTQSKNDQYILPKDFQLKHLQSNKLYVKVKRFIDQSEIHHEKSVGKNHYIKSKNKDEVFNLPISLKQASQYQQFNVIKVNKYGIEQQRILGIDQDKIYNYSLQTKQQKKEPGFFRKLFGINETTGTKRPFRLIKDIIQIHSTLKGFNLTYKDKTIVFQVKDSQVKQQIIRKVQFLVNYASNEHKNIIKK